MAGLNNHDSSFFQLFSPDSEVVDALNQSYLISLTIKESMYQLPSGTISMNDPYGALAKAIRVGMKLRIGWGYKDMDSAPRSLEASLINIDEFSGAIERRGFEAIVESPSGSGGSNGIITYNCSFTSVGLRGGDDVLETFNSGTKADVVHTVLDRMGISRANRDVRFIRGSEAVNDKNPVVQEESNFSFLTRLASREWRTFFAVGYASNRKPWAMFVDPEIVGRSAYNNSVVGAFGQSTLFDYKGLVSNVISYSWRNNQGRAGTGDSVRIVIVDGVPTFTRYIAEQQTIVTWQLNQEAVEAAINDAQAQSGFAGAAAFTAELLKSKSFEEIKRFFTPVLSETAPQGYGYEIDMECLGNPMVTAGNLVKFSGAFPPMLGADNTNWYVKDVSHSITQRGYMMSVHVADAYSISPTGGVL
jgi:hypothetical protein